LKTLVEYLGKENITCKVNLRIKK